MRSVQLLLSAIGALIVPAPLAAQQSEPVASPPIVVTGEREASEAERRREASRFFDSHAVRTRIGQLARWHEPVCVRAWGLPGEMNARVATRVMDIAERLGIPTNRAELCRPNVRIGFTGEPQAMIERAVRRNRMVIGFHYAARRDDIMQVRQPVQAWYVTRTRAGGTGVAADQAGVQGVIADAGTIDQAGVRAPGGAAGSRLGSGSSSGLAHVLIFADTRTVAGEEVDSIAELLAYLALAQTPVAETCDATDTILNLMNPACPPERRPTALTRQDNAYLRALYTVDPTWGPALQRGSVVMRMTDVLGAGN
jgi:hypothetical protein